ncbi:SusC/RagA family TonB-linked outer membrane protein [Pedobacter mucosus]|uniref:SusC/RagA family TonB-linked outer membrane protein n=1 Tax=Pedobacter mucosus TaxID=2895286 RepID=UPI001EE44458|nr:SusC/RagA family TonB-linked outer membrane protein [Pedobacter mucosus]UKT63402.1 SusC/RagA family TonB-linked outer membrane protein [Pedobacter mucosus]
MKKLLQSLFVLLFIALNAMAQERTITGTVTAKEDGLPIPGVTVRIKNSTEGSTTNSNGKYSLKTTASGSIQLDFSSIGFGTVTKLLPVGATTLNAVLESESGALDEVVVTGYGSGRRISSVVGSVTVVGAKTVENKPVANAFDALQGKVAGLQVFSSSGEPSTTASLRLHGVGSLGASNAPLFLLDGIQVDESTILNMNPNDIETVSVLKDASSTSIYGARAANGVLYVTTKRGKVGADATITVQGQYTVANPASDEFYRNFLNTAQLSQLQIEQGLRTPAATASLLAEFPNDTKWYDYYYKKDVPTYQTDLTISGGGGKTAYYISGSFFKGEGNRFRSGFDRYTMRSNLTTTLNQYIKIGMNLSAGTSNTQTNGLAGNDTNGPLALLAQPWFSPYDANGNEYYGTVIPGWGRYSPRYIADKTPFTRNRLSFNPSGFVEITPVKNVTIKSQAGIDGFIDRETSARLASDVRFPGAGTLSEYYSRRINKTLTNTIEYRFSLEKHNFSVLGGQEYVDGVTQEFGANTSRLPNDNLFILQNGDASNRGVSSSKSEYAFKSLFGRLEYNFDNKYFIDGSIREDKSSRFGANKQTATFWSVGGMWRAKKESFLEDVKWLTDLTVRASTGTSGNSAIGNYESLATAAGSPNYNGLPGVAQSAAGNPDLGWERQQKTSAGFKASFLDRIRLDVEFYYRETSQQLINVPQAYTTGYSLVRTNVGALQNKGVDITLDFDVYRNDKHGAFVTPYINANMNRNKITELFQGKNYYVNPGTGVLWAIGEPVSYVYPMWAGVNPANGLPQWYIPNSGDGSVQTRTDPTAVTSTFSAANLQQNTGIQRYAWLNGGFGVAAGYEGIYINADFTYSKGKYMINNDRYFFENPTTFSGFNQSVTVLDYWKTPGQTATFPNLTQQFTQFDSRLIEDASFIRLKNLQVGYNLPRSILEKTKAVKGVKVFFLARNLLTFTEYTGPDPEVDSNISLGAYPNTRQVGFGLQLTF